MNENEARIRKWRLLLGRESEERWKQYGSGTDKLLSDEDRLMDIALDAIYNADAYFSYGDGNSSGGMRGGRETSTISRWLGDIRSLFPPDLVKLVQGDAVERCGLKELLFEPELLDAAEPSVDLGSMLLLLKDQVPQQSKESARRFIQRIVEEIQRRLADDLRRSVTAACKRTEHTPIPSASGLDFKKTIRHGLKNYDAAKKRILPEKYYFFAKQQNNAAKYHIILDIDQSGSMGESVLYASVMSSILASLRTVKTNVVAFTTEVVDLSDKTEDPVELLFGFQLGGGTDINKIPRHLLAEEDPLFPNYRPHGGRKPRGTHASPCGDEGSRGSRNRSARDCGRRRALLRRAQRKAHRLSRHSLLCLQSGASARTP